MPSHLVSQLVCIVKCYVPAGQANALPETSGARLPLELPAHGQNADLLICTFILVLLL